jgi:DNA-binding NarL/FixJ family response regulator
MQMLSGERAYAEDPVVAGDISVYCDLIAERLGARQVLPDDVGDARLVVICGPEPGPSRVARLTRHPDRRVVVLGATDDVAISYYDAGAFDVLPSDASLTEIRAAVEKARRGERSEPSPRHTRLMFDRIVAGNSAEREGHRRGLTPREFEVAKLLPLPNKEIAGRLYIAESTVKKHVNKILRKLGVRGRHDVPSRLGL